MKKANEQLADWLKTEGRKQNWLAAQVNCGESTLRSWLKGRAVPAFVFRMQLERVTGLQISHEAAWHETAAPVQVGASK